MYYAHQPSGQRKRRRQALLLIVVSVLFVLAGAGMVASGETGAGWAGVIFFSGCLLAGIAQWRGARTDRSSEGSGGILLIAGSYLFGIACLVILAAQVLGLQWTDSYRLSGPLLTVIAAIGTVFFGGGAVLLTVRAVRQK